MTFQRFVNNILAVTLIALVLPGLMLCVDGCADKEEAGPETTAEAQQEAVPETVSPDQATPEGSAQPAGDKEVVSAGDRVSIQYRGTLDDGSVFDQSAPGRPLVFVAGVGQVIPGFDNAVIGMKMDEEKTVTIPAAEAYGSSNPKMIRNVPRSSFAGDFQGQMGDEVTLTNQTGQQLRGKLAGMSADSLLIDFNHPLAGQNLTFDIKVVGIQ
jgi:peptidylprolyl isomerase